MATTVTTPVLTNMGVIQSLTGLAASSFVTATFNITGAWEIRLPFQGVQASNVSAGPECWVYEAIIGTPTYTTVPIKVAIDRSASGNDVKKIRLDTGAYCLALMSGGPNTATVGVLTADVITSIVNN